MEPGEGAGMMSANSSAQAADARSSLAFHPPTTPSSACGAGREEMPVEPNAARVMKIMVFSIKLDKFTGFFDKFLNLSFPLCYYDSVSYLHNLASCIQIWRRKKFFGSPAFSRNSPHWRAGRRRVRSLRPPPSVPDSGVPSPSARSGAQRGEKAKGLPHGNGENSPRLFARTP